MEPVGGLRVFRFGVDDYVCMECGAVLSHEVEADEAGWCMAIAGDVLLGFVCPECLTDEQAVEAQVDDALGKWTFDAAGFARYEEKEV